MSNRIEKGNSLLKRALSEVFINELNDPRLLNEMVTISQVRLSPDLKYAKVYVSLYGEKNEKAVLDAIKSASPYIRHALSSKVKFRVLPELHFEIDTSEEHSEKINSLLKTIKYSDDQ